MGDLHESAENALKALYPCTNCHFRTNCKEERKDPLEDNIDCFELGLWYDEWFNLQALARE